MCKASFFFFQQRRVSRRGERLLSSVGKRRPAAMRTPDGAATTEEPAVPSFTCGICYSEDVVEAGCLDSCEHA